MRQRVHLVRVQNDAGGRVAHVHRRWRQIRLLGGKVIHRKKGMRACFLALVRFKGPGPLNFKVEIWPQDPHNQILYPLLVDSELTSRCMLCSNLNVFFARKWHKKPSREISGCVAPKPVEIQFVPTKNHAPNHFCQNSTPVGQVFDAGSNFLPEFYQCLN